MEPADDTEFSVAFLTLNLPTGFLETPSLTIEEVDEDSEIDGAGVDKRRLVMVEGTPIAR
ncbi:hypothetical protein L195_g063931, partial [Trifolium pratense]